MKMNLEEVRAAVEALDTLPLPQRMAELRRLATVVLPQLLDDAHVTGLTVVARDGDRILLRCELCGSETWQSARGEWFAELPR